MSTTPPLSLEQTATLRAAMDAQSDPAAELRAVDLSEATWIATQAHWLEALADDMDRGEMARLDTYRTAYRKTWKSLTGLDFEAALPAANAAPSTDERARSRSSPVPAPATTLPMPSVLLEAQAPSPPSLLAVQPATPAPPGRVAHPATYETATFDLARVLAPALPFDPSREGSPPTRARHEALVGARLGDDETQPLDAAVLAAAVALPFVTKALPDTTVLTAMRPHPRPPHESGAPFNDPLDDTDPDQTILGVRGGGDRPTLPFAPPAAATTEETPLELYAKLTAALAVSDDRAAVLARFDLTEPQWVSLAQAWTARFRGDGALMHQFLVLVQQCKDHHARH